MINENKKRITFVANNDDYSKLQEVQKQLGTRTYAEALRVLISDYVRRNKDEYN